MSDPLGPVVAARSSSPVAGFASKALTLICSQLLVYSFSLAGDIDHSRIGADKNPLAVSFPVYRPLIQIVQSV